MKANSIQLHCLTIAVTTALAWGPLHSQSALAQRDTIHLHALNDTLAINALGDTLTVHLPHDTTLVILDRDPISLPFPEGHSAEALTASPNQPPQGKRKFLGRVADMSKTVLRQTRIKVGQNIGASAPFGLPENSTILSFAPIFAPSIAIEKKITIHQRLYVIAGIRFEYKGMKTRAAVENFQTEVPQAMNGQILIFAGAFTGENVTNVVNSYIAIPARIGVQITKNYALEAGGFVALATARSFSGRVQNGYLWTRPSESEPASSKIPIESAEYNFNSEVSRFDAGVELYGSHHLGANILLDAGLGVGLIPLFNRERFKGIPFTMYNIYLNIALGYRFD